MSTGRVYFMRCSQPTTRTAMKVSYLSKRGRNMHRRSGLAAFYLIWSMLVLIQVGAVNIQFENCLDRNIIESEPRRLQFVPLYLSASFRPIADTYDLNTTIYGNVTGQTTEGPYPPAGDLTWSNPNNTFGKIVDISESNNRLATLFSKYQVLTYTAFMADPKPFCGSLINGSCPLGPSFGVSATDQYSLPSFSASHGFLGSYSFSTIISTIRVQSGDKGAPDIACVSANITPDIGSTISNALTFVPAALLLLVAVANIFAAILSPWGSSDLFKWTSNYGRDEDLLRLVTPGFGDCLQYIQFIVLSGSLNLAYPGYYQPVISRASWSILMFNESVVSRGPGYRSIVDGIYNVSSSDGYGLQRMSQLAGISGETDIWAVMVIWLVGLTCAAILLCQSIFLVRLGYRALSNTQEQDLRSKNWPFTCGTVVRLLFNFLLLPTVTLSMFQLVLAPNLPAILVAMAVFLLALELGLTYWIFRFIFTTRPRAHLFDDLPTVLMYGPLYNTYSDDAAPFALIPVLLNYIRGIAIGAVQPSGIAQLILLAICEVILILTIHAFRPFQSPVSMNACHTFFSVIRLVTTLLSVSFVPSLDVSESSKGWIGYVILLLHAVVLAFGFFLNSIQTLLEVLARLAGAGGEARGGLATVFGMRELSKRTHRRDKASVTSKTAILAHEGDSKFIQLVEGRSRSLSVSSAALLNRQMTGSQRGSGGFDQFSQGGELSMHGGTSPGSGTPGRASSPMQYLSGSFDYIAGPSSRGHKQNSHQFDITDPYYRPPRTRSHTLIDRTSRRMSKESNNVGEANGQSDQGDSGIGDEMGEQRSSSQYHGTLSPAYLRSNRDDSDVNLADRRKRTDYAVRESDFYYGISRGPALSSLQTRRLRTGPADPMGPVSSTASWIKGLFGSKRKDKEKGFEVVRSQRALELIGPLQEDDSSFALRTEAYQDTDRTLSDTFLADAKRSTPVQEIPGYMASMPSDQARPDEIEHFDRMGLEATQIDSNGRRKMDTGGSSLEWEPQVGDEGSSAEGRLILSEEETTILLPNVPRRSSRRTPSSDRSEASASALVASNSQGGSSNLLETTPRSNAAIFQSGSRQSLFHLPFTPSKSSTVAQQPFTPQEHRTTAPQASASSNSFEDSVASPQTQYRSRE